MSFVRSCLCVDFVFFRPQQYHRVEMIISQNHHTPTSISRPVQTPQTEPMQFENTHTVVAHPRQQHRRSRSLSEVWLEHRPQGTLNTGRRSEMTERLLICSVYRNVVTTEILEESLDTTRSSEGRDRANDEIRLDPSESRRSRRDHHRSRQSNGTRDGSLKRERYEIDDLFRVMFFHRRQVE